MALAHAAQLCNKVGTLPEAWPVTNEPTAFAILSIATAFPYAREYACGQIENEILPSWILEGRVVP